MIIIISSLSPTSNCSAPSTGPADTSEENVNVKNVKMPPVFFMLGLND